MAWGTPSTEKKNVEKKKLSDLFIPSTQIKLDNGLKCAIYGKAKVGKTHFCLTAPTPIYFLDTEGSAKINIKQFPQNVQEQCFIFSALDYATKDAKRGKIDVVESLDTLFEAVDLITDETINNPDFSGTIVVDSGTDVWDWLGTWLEERADVKTTKSGQMMRTEWGKANGKYAQFMQQLLKSNMNVIATFRAVSAIDNQGANLGYDNPKWQKNTDYWFDLIAEMKVTSKRELICQGDRFGLGVGHRIANPTWQSLVEDLRQNINLEIF